MKNKKTLASVAVLALTASLGVGAALPASAAPSVAVPASSHQVSRTAIPIVKTVDEGTLNAVFTPTSAEVVDGVLVLTGNLTGEFTPAGDTAAQAFEEITDLAVTVTNPTAAPGASCQILNLDLGPLDLDLLGLVVQLDEVNLDIIAEPGPGNLLGNLLCAVAGLLDGGLLGGGLGNLLDNLLGRLNDLLG